jgi:hypothetical protein
MDGPVPPEVEQVRLVASGFYRFVTGIADSDEAAQAFRFDGARYSDMMSPRAWSLAGW